MSRVLLLATVPWAGWRLSDQHLAAALGRHHDLVYVEPMTSVLRQGRTGLVPHVEEVARGVRRVSMPGLPGGYRRGVWPANVALERLHLRRVVERLGPFDAAIVTAAVRPHLDLLGDATRVYTVKDDPTSLGRLTGQPAGRIEAGHDALLAQADIVTTPSEHLASTLRTRHEEVAVVPHGIDRALLEAIPAATADRGGLQAPVAAYLGGLTRRVSWPHLEAVADRGISLLLVGSVEDGEPSRRLAALAARDNVAWLGPRPYDELAPVLAGVDVGLVPYVDDEFNRASFPLKVLDYLAGGATVVSTPLPALQWYAEGLVRTAGATDAFAEAVGEELGRGAETHAAAREFAAQHTWDDRAATLAGLIGI